MNDFGYIQSCSDIYLNLENNGEDLRANKSSTNHSPSRKAGPASSSQKTDGARTFSNACLDNVFIAPETLFLKFLDQTSALDVWSFGMIMFCLLLGKKPKSFYAIYRAWYKKCHGHDAETAVLPFIPPSQANFLYDPFAMNLENPFDDSDDLTSAGFKELLDPQGSKPSKVGEVLSFENFIKCLKSMSYSALFTTENSKKFHFKTISEQVDEHGLIPG